MKNIYIIGAGQLGSRHLQALKKVNIPLDIKVIDPSIKSLQIAQKRYKEAEKGKINHKIIFFPKINGDDKFIDLAIIATNSDVRKKAIEQVLNLSKVKYFILEKLLFQKKQDYFTINHLLKKNHSKAWVNCAMRNTPFYYKMKSELDHSTISYFVTGSQFGLATNSIHYIDHLAFLTDCLDYTVNTKSLDPKPIKSKRKGFLELNGTLNIAFGNGSCGTLVCYPQGDAPVQVEINSHNFRCIGRVFEGKAWVSKASKNWRWQEVDLKIPLQSQATTKLVENILNNENCPLTSFQDSIKLHLPLLDSLLNFLNQHSLKKFNYYPFT